MTVDRAPAYAFARPRRIVPKSARLLSRVRYHLLPANGRPPRSRPLAHFDGEHASEQVGPAETARARGGIGGGGADEVEVEVELLPGCRDLRWWKYASANTAAACSTSVFAGAGLSSGTGGIGSGSFVSGAGSGAATISTAGVWVGSTGAEQATIATLTQVHRTRAGSHGRALRTTNLRASSSRRGIARA